MVSVPHVIKHLIKFPIALDYSTLKDSRAVEQDGKFHQVLLATLIVPPSVLLKADTGADINLMNRTNI